MRICIVGAGAAGLPVIKALKELEQVKTGKWAVDCFEQREDIGGIWLPAPAPGSSVPPPTPLYDSVFANTPHTIMCYPTLWFPPSTPLYPPHETIETYLRTYAKTFSLYEYIKLNSEVVFTKWDKEKGKWIVRVQSKVKAEKPSSGDKVSRGEAGGVEYLYDKVVIANGHNAIPSYPPIPELSSWQSSGLVTHALWYRHPIHLGSKILVVGDGNSGVDIAKEMCKTCNELIHSAPHAKSEKGENIRVRGRLVSLSNLDEGKERIAYFDDGQPPESEIDHIILATGYDVDIPFFKNVKRSSPPTLDPLPTHLYMDKKVAFPLLKQIFPLYEHPDPKEDKEDLSFPPTTVAIVGILNRISTFPLFEVQARYVAHIFSQPNDLDIDACKQEILDRIPYLASQPTVGSSQSAIAAAWHGLYGDEQFPYRDSLNKLASPSFPPETVPHYVVPEWIVHTMHNLWDLKALWDKLVEKGDGEAEELCRGVGEGKDPESEWKKLTLELVERALKEKEEGKVEAEKVSRLQNFL